MAGIKSFISTMLYPAVHLLLGLIHPCVSSTLPGPSYVALNSYLVLSTRTAVDITNDLPQSSGTVKVKAMSMYTVYDGNVDICNGAVTATDGATCPGAGQYSFETGFPLPGKDESWYSNLYGMWVNLNISFNFGGSETTCSLKIRVSKGYQMSYTVAAVGGAVGVASLVALALGIKRRRRVAIQLPEEEGTTTHFEMMESDGVQV